MFVPERTAKWDVEELGGLFFGFGVFLSFQVVQSQLWTAFYAMFIYSFTDKAKGIIDALLNVSVFFFKSHFFENKYKLNTETIGYLYNTFASYIFNYGITDFDMMFI